MPVNKNLLEKESNGLAGILQDDLGLELVDMHIQGYGNYSLLDIFEIKARYTIKNIEIAAYAIKKALYGTKELAGLITGDERNEAYRQYESNLRKRASHEAHKRKVGGFYEMSEDRKKDVSIEGVRKRGQVPVSKKEIEMIIGMTEKPEYRKGNYLLMDKIAEDTNKKKHKGKKVRTARSIREIIRRYTGE